MAAPSDCRRRTTSSAPAASASTPTSRSRASRSHPWGTRAAAERALVHVVEIQRSSISGLRGLRSPQGFGTLPERWIALLDQATDELQLMRDALAAGRAVDAAAYGEKASDLLGRAQVLVRAAGDDVVSRTRAHDRPRTLGLMAPAAVYDRLSALDESFLHLERPETPMHVGAMAVLERAPFYDARRSVPARRRAGPRRVAPAAHPPIPQAGHGGAVRAGPPDLGRPRGLRHRRPRARSPRCRRREPGGSCSSSPSGS